MTLTLDRAVRLLSSFAGRDKTIRTCYYALLLLGSRGADARILALAKQLSAARLVARRFNDLPMILANIKQLSSCAEDVVSHRLQSAVNLLYLFYHPVEHIAFFGDLSFFKADTSKWWARCIWIWVFALACSIAKSLRDYYALLDRKNALTRDQKIERRELAKRERNELITLVQHLADFMNAINFLPAGVLWSQTFPQWKVASFGLIASVAGLAKLYAGTA